MTVAMPMEYNVNNTWQGPPVLQNMPIEFNPVRGIQTSGWAPAPAGFQWANGYQQGQIPGVSLGGTSGNGGFTGMVQGAGNWLQNNGSWLGPTIGGIGAYLGAKGASAQANQARSDGLYRMGQIDQWTEQFMNPQQSQGAQWLQQLLGSMQGGAPQQYTNTPVNYYDVNAATVNPTQFNPLLGGGTALPEWINTEINNANPLYAVNATTSNAYGPMNDPRMADRYLGMADLENPASISSGSYNRSQDALMQLVNGNGGYNSITAQLDPTNGMALNDIVQGNTRFDTTPMFDALAPVEDRARATALRDLNAQAGSLGARLSTAMADRSADLLTRLTEEANLRRQNLAFQASEAAQGRRLQASDLINTRDNIFNQVQIADQRAGVDATGNRIQGAASGAASGASELNARIQGSSSYNNARASLLSNAMDVASRLALGNQSTGANISMFNAGAENTASLQNASQANTLAQANAANTLTAQGQRLQQILGNNTFNMNGAQIRAEDLARLASILQSNASQTNSVNLANANNRLGADTTNANNGLAAFLGNQTANQNWFNNQLNGYTTMMNDSNAQQQRILQALGIRAGIPLPGASAGVGSMAAANSMGDLGALLMMMNYRRG